MHRPPSEGNFCHEQRILKNMSFLQSTIGTWAMLTEGTEWLMSIQFVQEHGSDKRKIFPTLGPNYAD
jgi:hypothetical protein